jgi:hypothetical protein
MSTVPESNVDDVADSHISGQAVNQLPILKSWPGSLR